MSKSQSRKRNVILKVCCLDEEAAAIRDKAEAGNVTVSELLRCAALNRKMKTPIDVKLMKELLRLGGLQKHLYTQMQEHMTTELSKQFSDVLVEIKKAILALGLR